MRNVLGRNRAIDIQPIERRRRRNELRRMRRVRVPQNELLTRQMNHTITAHYVHLITHCHD